jgi:hypothetical protein
MPVPTATATAPVLKVQAQAQPEAQAETQKVASPDADSKLVDPYNYVGEVFGDVPADYPYADFLREWSGVGAESRGWRGETLCDDPYILMRLDLTDSSSQPATHGVGPAPRGSRAHRPRAVRERNARAPPRRRRGCGRTDPGLGHRDWRRGQRRRQARGAGQGRA